MDVCEDGFTGKRIAFIVPMVLMGMLFISRGIGKGLAARMVFHVWGGLGGSDCM